MLSEFRGTLTFTECLYVFGSLLQQSYSRLCIRKKLQVSDELCVVSSLGEVTMVKPFHKTPHELVCNLVSAISRVKEVVARLLEGEGSCEYRYLEDKLKTIIHSTHPHEEHMY